MELRGKEAFPAMLSIRLDVTSASKSNSPSVSQHRMLRTEEAGSLTPVKRDSRYPHKFTADKGTVDLGINSSE